MQRNPLLAQAILLKIHLAFAGGELVFSFASQVRRRFMPRKGWTTMAVPDGWLQVLRGPRPPSQKWERRPHQWRLHNQVRRRRDVAQETSNAGVPRRRGPMFPQRPRARQHVCSHPVGSSPRGTWRSKWPRGDAVAQQLEGIRRTGVFSWPNASTAWCEPRSVSLLSTSIGRNW